MLPPSPLQEDETRRALAVAQAKNDAAGVVIARIGLAIGAAHSGRFADARTELNAAVDASRAARDADGEAAALADLGVVDAAAGQYPEAIQSVSQAYDLYAAIARRASTAQHSLDSYSSGSSPPPYSAISGMMQGAMLARDAAVGLEITLLNLGTIQAALGQYQEAMGYYQRAISQHPVGAQASDDQSPSGGTQGIYLAMATVASLAGHADEAKGYLTRGKAAAQSFLNDEQLGFVDLQPRSTAAVTAGATPASENERIYPSLRSEATRLNLLMSEAQAAEAQGHRQPALDGWLKIAGRAAAENLVDTERTALAHAQRLARALHQADLAIYVGKRAVNAYQRERKQLASMDREARKAFARESRDVYDALADDLVDANRLAEAELVLRLLREEGTLPGDARLAAMPYSVAERRLVSEEDQLVARWRKNAQSRADYLQANANAPTMADFAAGQERYQEMQFEVTAKLLDMLEKDLKTPSANRRDASAAADRAKALQLLNATFGPDDCESAVDPREAALRKRFLAIRQAVGDVAVTAPDWPPGGGGPLSAVHYACLQRDSQAIESQFAAVDPQARAALTASAPEFSAADRQLLDAHQLALAALPPGTVSLHFVRGTNALRIILCTAYGRISRDSATSTEALDSLVLSLRQSLTDPRSDPRAAAQALYQLLIAPVGPQLDRAHAVTLQLALDGDLRYVPFAALFDGEHYLVERYALVLETTGAPQAAAAVSHPAWRVAAFGSSRGGLGLRPLPSVADELRGIVRDDSRHATGPLPGILRLDDEFTAEALRAALMQRYPVIHIASHFDLNSQDPAESFLLLGNGTRLTLQEIKDQNYRFEGVELLTLSACDTARDLSNRYGQELEGLATFMQNQGAGAVLSTLWSVDDASTARLMKSLYQDSLTPGITKAQSLRAAQLALMGRQPAESTSDDRARGASRPHDDLESKPVDLAHPYSHPYFWAPFVLNGNWL